MNILDTVAIHCNAIEYKTIIYVETRLNQIFNTLYLKRGPR